MAEPAWIWANRSLAVTAWDGSFRSKAGSAGDWNLTAPAGAMGSNWATSIGSLLCLLDATVCGHRPSSSDETIVGSEEPHNAAKGMAIIAGQQQKCPKYFACRRLHVAQPCLRQGNPSDLSSRRMSPGLGIIPLPVRAGQRQLAALAWGGRRNGFAVPTGMIYASGLDSGSCRSS